MVDERGGSIGEGSEDGNMGDGRAEGSRLEGSEDRGHG